MRLVTNFSLLLAALAMPAWAASIPEIANHPQVAAAFRHIDQHKEEQLAEWIRITEIGLR